MLGRWQLDQVVATLNSGGIIAYPTESVFGLGCDPANLSAVNQILRLKNRPAHKGLIIVVSDIRQASPWIMPLTPGQLAKVMQPQSRATTWLLRKRKSTSFLLSGRFETLAVRITQHPVAWQICQHNGRAMVSTSCNVATKPAMSKVTQVRSRMRGQLDWIVSGCSGGQLPSRIVDLCNDRVLRE